MKHPLITVASFQMDYESSQWLSQLGTIQKQMHAGLREGIDFEFNKDDGSVKMVEKKDEYIKLDRDKSTFKSHRDFCSEKEITFKHL